MDDLGTVIEEVPFTAEYVSASKAQQPAFPVGRSPMAVAASPDNSGIVSGSYDGIVPSHCPIGFRITLLRVVSDGGSTQTFATPGWKTRAIPRRVPPISSRYSELSETARENICAHLALSSAGRVLKMESVGSAESEVFNVLSMWMKSDWTFHPATVEGSPTDSEIKVLFVVGSGKPANLPSNECTEGSFTLIRLVDDVSIASRAKRTVYYGSLIENSIVE